MTSLRAAIFAALFVSNAGLSTPALAEDVTLTSRDGAIELSGTLLGWDGDFYRIETAYGVLSLDGSRVTCTGPACPPPGAPVSRFTLAGAGEMAQTLLPALIEDFARAADYALTETDTEAGTRLYRLADPADGRAVAAITLRSSTTEDGVVDLITDQADFALALREVDDNERLIATDAGLGDLTSPRQYRVLARDALVPVVHATNPVERFGLSDLAAIFAGEIDNWSELGGADSPITLHLTDPRAGIGAAFANAMMLESGKPLAPTLVVHSDVDTLGAAVAQDAGAIGVTTLSHIGETRALALTGSCGLAVAAEEVTIAAGDYPLTLPFYLYLPGRRLPKVAREMLAYLRAPAAQEVVRTAGFVDQRFTEIPLAVQGERLANAIRAAGPEVSLGDLQRMVGHLSGKQRLSVSFRFEDGTTELDAPSRAGVATLAAALAEGAFEGRSLSFAGFSDGSGAAAANLTLSERRAETARAAVRAWTGAYDLPAANMEAAGFGEALPIACDDTPWGRQANRRVEIWVD